MEICEPGDSGSHSSLSAWRISRGQVPQAAPSAPAGPLSMGLLTSSRTTCAQQRWCQTAVHVCEFLLPMYFWMKNTLQKLIPRGNVHCNRHKSKENVLPWCYRSQTHNLCLLRPKSRVSIRLFIPLHSLLQNHLLLTLLLSVVDDFRL